MRIQKNTKNRLYSKRNTIVAVVLLIITIFTGVLLYVSMSGQEIVNESYVDLDKPTEDEKRAGDKLKQHSASKANSGKKPQTSDTPPAPLVQAEGKSIIQLDITAANQNGPTIQIRSSIGTVTTTGVCSLSLSKADKVITRTASIQALPTTSTCQGFDVPMSELGTGTWVIDLEFENESLTGKTSREINIK